MESQRLSDLAPTLGFNGPVAWNANGYFSQGIAGVTLDEHLKNLDRAGISPGGRGDRALADLSRSLETNVNLRAAGQLAFSRLPGSMTFVLGSDVGLRGLPGTLISGDSGYMGLAELEWTAWKQDDQSVALIPYIGFGGIHTDFERVVLEDSIGVGGLIGRYRNGRWEAELGWVDTFNSNDNLGLWNDWILGSGLYTKVRYSF